MTQQQSQSYFLWSKSNTKQVSIISDVANNIFEYILLFLMAIFVSLCGSPSSIPVHQLILVPHQNKRLYYHFFKKVTGNEDILGIQSKKYNKSPTRKHKKQRSSIQHHPEGAIYAQ
ncbi:5613_t:CDS:2 [Diversispora eburnea]|uniref:5613_t:CDS:1 n=1 Tax=Diversispora eburnea TaxID=1213867 RepID=A0A9N8VHD2_9GLOM|nr:5613_t:CDS:2 [Diversispora eburnea]